MPSRLNNGAPKSERWDADVPAIMPLVRARPGVLDLCEDDQLRALITEVLPVSLDALASSLGKSLDDILSAVISAVSRRIQSLRITAQRPD